MLVVRRSAVVFAVAGITLGWDRSSSARRGGSEPAPRAASEKAYVARSVDDPCASGGLPEGLNAEQRNRGKLASVFIDTLVPQLGPKNRRIA